MSEPVDLRWRALCPECDEFVEDCRCSEVRAHELDLQRDEADEWYAALAALLAERAPA